ncbi:phosphatidylserine decarboxylase family protein [candidate division KSB1 bacterium]|nr:phosphatidylserine decarboxylase family protein [candidate division KSB1 bacterium]
MKISKDGYGIIAFLGFLNIMITIAYFLPVCTWHSGFLYLAWVVLIFILFFFRDPDRTIPNDPNVVIAPADGKIVNIVNEYEDHLFESNVVRISIFLSLFDVHINRMPISGKIIYFNYLKGKFIPAFKEKASLENEQTIIGIENDGQIVLLKQIAGIIARRIVCYVRTGHRVKIGQRFGMIRFGSRVDLFLPPDTELNVHENDRVKGGETIIGRFIHTQ